MFDVLQVLFWSLTYVLIIIAGLKSKSEQKVAIPYIACIQNFTWELLALIDSKGFWAHILWLSLDLFIIVIAFVCLKSTRQKIGFIVITIVYLTVFKLVFSLKLGMLYSSFVIDLVMAVLFLVDRKQMTHTLQIPIATTKLIGDAFAGIHYGMKKPVLAYIAIIVLACNLMYLIYSIKNYLNRRNDMNLKIKN